jgi:hypothetical protein
VTLVLLEMAKKTTRKSVNDWILGVPSETDLSLGVRLPLKGDLMRRFLEIRMSSDKGCTRDIFKQILKELKLIWERAGIPIKPQNNCLRQLLEIHDTWLKVKSTAISDRHSKWFLINLEKFNRKMNQLCDLSPSNVEEILKKSRNPNCQEDIEFLKGQREFPQVGIMAGVDGNTVRREKRRRARSRQTNSDHQLHGSSSTDSTESEISIDNLPGMNFDQKHYGRLQSFWKSQQKY